MLAFSILDINQTFVDKMASLGLAKINKSEILRLKQYKIDQAAIDNIKDYGLYNQQANTVIALAILKLDDSLIREVKALNINNYSMQLFLESRTGKNHNPDNDVEMTNALVNVVSTIYHL